ncbi:hypothetical protein MTR67_048169 [Solanum verrucosum]|uniref:Uncharacterized protein n=1 Tax=Solanum verrucosum TaxID=315347 RepID=A0AAF0ZZR9_SOLVR|nr:hypothetical protein MTR67_048169 [Solanum verrucosum]
MNTISGQACSVLQGFDSYGDSPSIYRLASKSLKGISTTLLTDYDYWKEKYDIPDSAKKWALEGNKNARRKYKNDLYEKHYKEYDNDDLRMENKPKDVSESDFKDLLKYWDSENFKAEMEKLQSQQSEDNDQSFDAFTAVMGDEQPGSLRLYG